jgi:hypothetical protein
VVRRNVPEMRIPYFNAKKIRIKISADIFSVRDGKATVFAQKYFGFSILDIFFVHFQKGEILLCKKSSRNRVHTIML